MKAIFSLLFCALFSMTIFGGEVTKTFYFSDYNITDASGYQLVNFDGCLNTGYTGEPSLPWFAVKLMLPPRRKGHFIHCKRWQRNSYRWPIYYVSSAIIQANQPGWFR